MSDSSQALPKGYRLHDYEILRVLGEGGFGVTYLAFEDALNRPVAIKEYFPAELATRDGTTVSAATVDDEETFQWGLTRFIDEAKILARFRNPNIVQVYRYVEENGTAYIVMEYVEGEPLSAFIAEHGTMSADAWLPWLKDLLVGLGQVHDRGFLHRDIKPGNIVIRIDEYGERIPVLLDFGAARQNVERAHTRIYTPGYAPPEQQYGDAEEGPWSDVFAMAAVTVAVLTGQVPSLDGAETSARLQGKVGDGLLRSLLWALEANPGKRPRSAGEWLESLKGGEPSQTSLEEKATTQSPTPTAAPVRRKTGWLLPATVVTVTVVVAVGAFWPLQPESPPPQDEPTMQTEASVPTPARPAPPACDQVDIDGLQTCYATRLAADSADDEARRRLDDIAAVRRRNVEEALGAGRFAEAEAELDDLRSIPGQQASADALDARLQVAVRSAEESRIAALFERCDALLRDDRLDEAWSCLASARAEAPGHPEASAQERAIARRALELAELALARQDFGEARASIARARRFGAEGDSLADLDRRVDDAEERLQAQRREPPPARTAGTPPAQASSGSASATQSFSIDGITRLGSGSLADRTVIEITRVDAGSPFTPRLMAGDEIYRVAERDLDAEVRLDDLLLEHLSTPGGTALIEYSRRGRNYVIYCRRPSRSGDVTCQ